MDDEHDGSKPVFFIQIRYGYFFGIKYRQILGGFPSSLWTVFLGLNKSTGSLYLDVPVT